MQWKQTIGRFSALCLFVMMFALALAQACKAERKDEILPATKAGPLFKPEQQPKQTPTQPKKAVPNTDATPKADDSNQVPMQDTPPTSQPKKAPTSQPKKKDDQNKPPKKVLPATKFGVFLDVDLNNGIGVGQGSDTTPNK